MAAFEFAGHALADVVEEAGAFRHVRIEADLARDERREERGLDRVIEDVLIV